MTEHEPTDVSGETTSGIYRKLTPKLLSLSLIILWAIGGALTADLWSEVKQLLNRVTTLEAQRAEDKESLGDLRTSIKEIQADIKELLREVRK